MTEILITTLAITNIATITLLTITQRKLNNKINEQIYNQEIELEANKSRLPIIHYLEIIKDLEQQELYEHINPIKNHIEQALITPPPNIYITWENQTTVKTSINK